jgi:hypothetical protein
MELSTFIGLLALVATVYTAYLQRRQVLMMKAAAASGRRATKNLPIQPWWRALTFLAVSFMAVLTWMPWIFSSYPQTMHVQYGNLPDGRLYISMEVPEDKPGRKIIGVAFHYRGNVDVNDAGGLQKSKPYDYRKGTQFLSIEPDQIFSDEVRRGLSGTNFAAFNVPEGITEDQFSTLRQAYKLGAKLIFSASKNP